MSIGKTASTSPTRSPRGPFRRLIGDREGATAIEFAILALPFFIVVFASIETFVAFAGEQLLANATDTLARRIRTGDITTEAGKDGFMTEAQFRQAFCEEIAVMMTCSATEATQPSKLYLDVRELPEDLSAFPQAVPRIGSDLDTSGFTFAPGGPNDYTMVRAYYRWTVITDLVRPLVTKLRSAGESMPRDYLMVATATFRNENY
ncbi:TadE/TadG family type IV pilus assembly protein [Sinorhizobium medicae]|uniref:TadE/TadG family type IV pilus assembly protein n=1 Tax=Sinorhizobium medicae TaxID=110321 RepID=UPI002AF6C815|nr:TadE/TadG family type IV pilus assembly protein [Sinorhizobium medicae]WQO45586.1 TadE/TadG family type IV pilus assembly protein [Sinorhizobium medicae]WQO65751.1 TadE/TadG family type IV pilus assembly protein [Sinorhizobium medicae]WQO72881.1 TadE/TadG family type IV pilus assembly protein [Sinorhizobium medicae]WQO92191.1 TadE/TadG family type IV pilus assembly protein [Sinorhizobium medicae]